MKSISLLNVSFSFGQDYLFYDLSISFNDKSKVAVIGENAVGKSTLLKLLSNKLEVSSGKIISNASTYLLNQINISDNKSGGEQQLIELNKAFASDADILLLDEPTNNLDSYSKKEFFNLLKNWNKGIVLVSHDRELLNKIDYIYELKDKTIKTFGGNYNFYLYQKELEEKNFIKQHSNAVNTIKDLRKSFNMVQKIKHEKESKTSPKSITFKARTLEIESENKKKINKKIQKNIELKNTISEKLSEDKIKIPLPKNLFSNKELINIEHLYFGYDKDIFNDFNLNILGNERVHLKGRNGTGKTTLIKIIMGIIKPRQAKIKLTENIIYLNQDLSLLNKNKSIIDNIIDFSNITINEAHRIAANFGFNSILSKKIVSNLSGGELLKAHLATIIGSKNQPELIILDEPTNNLDIKSIEVLEDTLNQYKGAILIVSHDETFINNININKVIDLDTIKKLN